MVEYLLDKYSASANSRNGYFLARAVLARHLPFVKLLLGHDADPSLNDGYAVNVAIGTGELALVKLLIEREPEPRPTEELHADDGVDNGDGRKKKKKKRRRESDGGGGGKRRKVGQRCKATSKMLEVALKEENWEIVTYLQAKGEHGSFRGRVTCGNARDADKSLFLVGRCGTQPGSAQLLVDNSTSIAKFINIFYEDGVYSSPFPFHALKPPLPPRRRSTFTLSRSTASTK